MKKPPSPSLFLVGAIWHFRYQRNGKRIQRSTRTTDGGRAEQIAWRAYRGEREIPTLAELAREWQEVHEPVVSDAHRRSVRNFSRRYLYGLGDLRIDRIGTEEVEAARNLHLAGRAPSSLNLWMRVLKLLFHWAVRRKILSEIPWQVKAMRLQKKPRTTLPVARIPEWLAAVDRACGRRTGLSTAVRLMVGIGLRESEALSSRWEWLDPARGLYTPGVTKGREATPVPVSGMLLEHLSPLRQPEGWIVVSPRGGTYSPGATRRVILVANRECGTPGVTPHRLRGTFASTLADLGVPLADIQKALRHKDSRTTMSYIEVDMSRIAAAQTEIDRRMGWRKKGEGMIEGAVG